MDTSDPSVPNMCNNNNSSTVKERMPLTQVTTRKTFSMQRLAQMVQMMAQKSCRRACELFCLPVGSLMYQEVTCCPAQPYQPTEERTTQAVLQNSPSTILILNISNSTLIDCVIGNDTYPSAVAESQPLMQRSELHMHDQMRCSSSHRQQGAAQISPPPPTPRPLPSEDPPSITIHSSQLNYVIIGNNNYMHAEHVQSTETEEPWV